MPYQCTECAERSETFKESIQHIIEHHPNSEIRHRELDGQTIKTINYKVTAELCREQGRTITIDEKNKKIHISKRNNVPKDSPFKKIIKFGKLNENEVCTSDVTSTNAEFCTLDLSQEDDTLAELVQILPAVISSFKDSGQLEEYVLYNKLVAEKRFPLDNIAFLLFNDVVRWFGSKSSSQFRYSEECKLFWNTGFKLFRGRFLRFMGGPKHSCYSINEHEQIGHEYRPEMSKINFIVPGRRLLNDENEIIQNRAPGIMKQMMQTVSKTDADHLLTYKICVDGKKINASSKGEVDLWGYESSPTFQQRKIRFENERDKIEQCQKKVEKLLTFGNVSLRDIHTEELLLLIEESRDIISILSYRIRDLREIKVSKESALQNIQSKVEGDWRSSKFAMVISSIRTSVYQIDNCVDDLLSTIEIICKIMSLASGARTLTCNGDEVSMQNQSNYVCLGSHMESNCDPSLIKQRSKEWFEIRDSCIVTGSTINKAIGLEGLKSQKMHLDVKAGRKQPDEISHELQEKFDHGAKNELNAVSTICSSFLPAFHPELKCFEEGCYVEFDNNKPCLVISPDGSLRNADLAAVSGIEIKCPMPGKIFTTPVHYKLPKYYVTQVLSEMTCLRVDNLYFCSYTKQSMTVLRVQYDPTLWGLICKRIADLDVANPPKRLGTDMDTIKQKIKEFCENNVHLVAEFKSKIALPCSHSSTESGRLSHTCKESTEEEVGLADLQRCCMRADEAISTCHRLSCRKASEVLVFLLADLDRIYKPEVPHAFPVAYALKGYSMSSETMRKMIQDVLNELFVQGLYTPVVSYDGQWASLSIRDEYGQPLTLLELQRSVYNGVKQMKKNEITERFFKSAQVKVKTLEELIESTDYKYDVNKKSVTISTIGGTHIFKPSKHISRLIKNTKMSKDKQKEATDKVMESDSDYVLSSLNANVLDIVSNEYMTILRQANKPANLGGQAHNHGIQIQLADTFMSENEETVNVASTSSLTDLQEEEIDENEAVLREDVNNSVDILSINDTEIIASNTGNDSYEHDLDTNNYDVVSNEHIACLEDNRSGVLRPQDMKNMLFGLQRSDKVSQKWKNVDTCSFESFFIDLSTLTKQLTKDEMKICLDSVKYVLDTLNLKFAKSWNKKRLGELLMSLCNKTPEELKPEVSVRRRRHKNPEKLITLCKRAVNNLPKVVMNAVIAEDEMPERIQNWRQSSPFSPITRVADERLCWFSCPEYNTRTLAYLFSFLDVHHLITNCRIKVCKDGIPERKISKDAWIYVARSNLTKLKVAHVVDLIDKQSDSIAKETFSKEVEETMRLKFPSEAYFCQLIREFYEAEDEPGLSAFERTTRRLALREWLLTDVNFCQFPPYGMYINGIPNVMFQGFMTNIERRIQLFPYVKCGSYCPRALGSLEAENLFGQFQDLDPKGTGVIKAEEVPQALEIACQLLKTRLQPQRPFHMTLSKQKVYPTNELIAESEVEYSTIYLYPQKVEQITLKNHMFDMKRRAKRKAQRKLVTISAPDDAARGARGVRQHFREDHSKLLADRRANMEFDQI